MINFDFQCKTEVIFGKDTEKRAGAESARFGSRVLLVYGGGSIKRTGLYNTVVESLKGEKLYFTELSGIKPNPVLLDVKKGIEICRKEKIDFILAVGGGSVIDTAKAISIGFYYDGDVWDFFAGKAVAKKALPIGVILTISAAGSETSQSAVITKEEGLVKKGLNSNLYRPSFAIMNPELTYTLPQYQTASGIADMMSHAHERYFTDVKDNDLTDLLTEATLRAIIKNALILKENPNDYNARAQIMLSGSIAHNDLLSMGKIGDFGTHRVEHELSALYGVTHGAGIAVITLAWMRYVCRKKPALFACYARNVWDVPEEFGDDVETALEGIKRLENFFKVIGLPVRLNELGVPEDISKYELMAQRCVAPGPQGQFFKIHKDDAVEIYKIAQRGE
ncbi:MAG: iron-containing alcohol dehydrogenase [Spirochaetia bacterium]|jgi:alcohol dehydrogenase YqhD (iron-dependent ADH family)|nr:iron-containing alcohol dehydrogenase [Spirochaetia bacterium]